MAALADDLHTVIDLKAKHFKKQTWCAWSDTDFDAYDKTRRLSQKERGPAILAEWEIYVEQRLVPLVREAVTQIMELARLMWADSVKDRKSFVETCVADWIIQPAAKHTRYWFVEACEGHLFVMASGPSGVSKWTIPEWLNRYPVEDASNLFIREKQDQLSDRLECVRSDEINSIAACLLQTHMEKTNGLLPMLTANHPPTPEDFSAWTKRQQCVGRILERHQGNMSNAEIRDAMKGTGHNPGTMAHIFRDKGKRLIGGPDKNTPIVKVQKDVYCLRRFFRT